MNKHPTSPHHSTSIQAEADACARVEVSEGTEDHEIGLPGDSISALIAFFKILDEWDREAKPQ
jgi:hypothetical protein